MNPILKLIGKDLKLFVRKKAELVVTFLIPIVMAIVFGFAFGGSGSSESTPMRLLFVDLDHSPLSQRLRFELLKEKTIELVDTIENDSKLIPIDSIIAINRIKRGRDQVALVVPRGALDTLAGVGKLMVTLWTDPKAKFETGITSGIVQKTVFKGIPELMGIAMSRSSSQSLDSNQAKEFDRSMKDLISRTFQIDLADVSKSWFSVGDRDALGKQLLAPLQNAAKQSDSSKQNSNQEGFDPIGNFFQFSTIPIVGEKVSSPAVAQSIAGVAVMFMFFSIGAGAKSLLKEKREGTLRRLLVSGLGIERLLVAKWIFLLMLGLVQLYVMFAVGALVFHLDLRFQPWQLFATCSLIVLAVTSFSMLLAALARSEEMADALVTVIALSMSAVGGSMFPSFMMPGWLQMVGKFTLNSWAMEALQNYFWRRLPIADSWLSYTVLLSFVVISVIVTFPLLRKKLAKG